MANIAISALPDATSAAAADEIAIVQSGTTKRLTILELLGSPTAIGGTAPAAGSFTTYTGTGAATITPATDVAPLVLKGHVGATANLLDVQQSDATSIFKVGVGAVATSVTAVGGTLDWSGTTGAFTVAGGVYIAKKLQVISDFAVNTNKFSVAAASGNTLVAGTVGVTGVTSLAAGTVSAPGLYLSSDTGTGLYRIGANNNGYTVSGTKLLDLSAASVGVTGVIVQTRSTNSGSEATGLSVADTRTGAGATGWAGKFELIPSIALGAYANAVYGLVTFGAAGSVTGLVGGVCGEVVFSAGTGAGTYTAFEAELGLATGGACPSTTSFMYCSLYGTGKATIDAVACAFQFAGLTDGTGNIFDSFTQLTNPACQASLRIMINGTPWYIPLADTAVLT